MQMKGKVFHHLWVFWLLAYHTTYYCPGQGGGLRTIINHALYIYFLGTIVYTQATDRP
jgi:hypothetical protein